MAEEYLGRPLDEALLNASLASCPTPGRFDVLARNPLLMIDACHNPQSCDAFVGSVGEIAPERSTRPTLLIAALTDKDAAGIVRSLVPAFPRIAVTQTDSPRALPACDLATLVRAELDREGRPATDLVAVYPCVPEALGALERAGEAVVAAGTITLAGEVAAFVAK